MADEYQPVVIMWIKSPWSGDEVNFALYESGMVIFRKGTHQFFSVQLDETATIDFIATLPIEAFFDLKQHYSISDATDQPDNIIVVWIGGVAKRVQLYGALLGKDTLPEIIGLAQYLNYPHPDAFWTIFQIVSRFEHEQATPWLPEKIQVKIWEWDTLAESIVWDPLFPDLNHPETQPSPYSLYNAHILLLPSEHLAEVERLRQLCKPILMNGKTWALSYRLPVPNETLYP